MAKRKPLLPNVPIYGFIGGIPETFGGRTSVCLQRANTFAELDQRYIEILTLSPKHGTDPEAVTERMRSEGRIGKRVSIRNVWADLRRASDENLRHIASTSANVNTVSQADTLLPYKGQPESVRINSNGRALQTDRFRADGTRVYSYRIDCETPGKVGGKTATLFSHSGEAIGQWQEQYELYFAWMDWIFDGRMTVLINDGPPLAKYLYKYRRSNVVFVQTIHSKHSGDPKSPTGRLSIRYLPTLKNMDQFDRVAVLTQKQYNDVIDQHYGMDNVEVLSNMFVANAKPKRDRANRHGGVMLARLSHQKRLDHAIEAVRLARANYGSTATLDIYGVSDNAEDALGNLIAAQDLSDSVRLCGYDPKAKSRFEEASFTLLTSEYEGQPLVLLEAMAAGCIPIAYNIEYGPADIITDGVDGFLVPKEDTDAMAGRIRDLEQMSERELKRMRKAAARRTRAFQPRVIAAEWGEMLAHAIDEKTAVESITGRARIADVSRTEMGTSIRIRVSGDATTNLEWATLTWEERGGRGFGRTPAKLHPDGDHVIMESHLSMEDIAPYLAKRVDFWVDLRVAGNPVRLRVKGASVDSEVLRTDDAVFYGTKFGSLSAIAVSRNT